MIYGYARVSTAYEQARDRNQTFDRQEMILIEHGVKKENIFCDRASGSTKTSTRPSFDKLMSIVLPGDTIIVSEMSRLSRSLIDFSDTVDSLIKRQIGITFIKESITIGTDGLNPINRLFFQILGAFNEFERKLISERVHEGMQASIQKGKVMGRPKKFTDEQKQYLMRRKIDGATYDELAEEFHVSKPTLVSLLKGWKEFC